MPKKWKSLLGCFLVVPLIFTVHVEKQYLLPRSVNIEKLEMIRVVGIDPMGDGVHLTLAASGEQQEDVKHNFLIEGEGNTVQKAVEDAQKTANKPLFWGHADVLVLGKDVIGDNISKYIDFLARDSKTRLSMKVILVKNGQAKDLLGRKGNTDQAIFEGLSEQLRNLRDLSYAAEVKMSDIIDSAGNARSSYLIPALDLVGEENYEISGAAAVKEGNVVRSLSAEESRAANLVRGDFFRSMDVLGTELLGRISVEADDSVTKIRFSKREDGVLARVDVSLVGTLSEQFTVPDYQGSRFDEATMKAVGEMWSEKLRSEIERIAQEDQVSGNDILGVTERLYRYRPNLYDRVANGAPLRTECHVTVRLKRVHVLMREI